MGDGEGEGVWGGRWREGVCWGHVVFAGAAGRGMVALAGLERGLALGVAHDVTIVCSHTSEPRTKWGRR